LILAAAKRGLRVFRFNTEDYPSVVGLSVNPLDPSSAVLKLHDDEVPLGLAKGIWIRRPQWPVISSAISDPLDRAFAQQEAVAAMGGVWRALQDRCVSPPDALQAARWKLAQLALATRLRLLVPPSIVSSDPERIREFRRQGRCVLKAVGDARIVGESGERLGYTTELEPGECTDTARYAPVLIQKLIEKVADWRITLVGKRLFPVRMTVPLSSPIDIRTADPSLVAFEARPLDDAVATKLVAFALSFGLRYAAFDMAEDRDGALWFLECNPGGQWAWLEAPAGVDITGAPIDLLLEPQA
jgi:glutathione synthase/RimK-type ligase-like ATP-grasp enzyme